MTVVLPKGYHAQKALENKKITCMDSDTALKQDIRALRIGILNIMPKAETYEFNLLHPLGRSILQIEPVWIKLKTHKYSSSDSEHLDSLYVNFEDAVKNKHLDGLIVTGAPVEEMEFEDVAYWEEIKKILTYAKNNIAGTLGICWGGLAVAKMLGIQKQAYSKKLFGVFLGKNLDKDHPVTGDLDDIFFSPHSRHAGLLNEDMVLERDKGNINLLAYGEDSGYFIFESVDKRFMAHLGHPEYNSNRLVEETLRDREKGRKDVEDPKNFDIDNPINQWRSHRNEFFTQWINFIYNRTAF